MSSSAAPHIAILVDEQFKAWGVTALLSLESVTGAPVISLTGILLEGEAGNDFPALNAPLRQEAIQFRIRHADVQSYMGGIIPKKNDRVTLDNRNFVVIAQPVRETPYRLTWLLDLQEAKL